MQTSIDNFLNLPKVRLFRINWVGANQRLLTDGNERFLFYLHGPNKKTDEIDKTLPKLNPCPDYTTSYSINAEHYSILASEPERTFNLLTRIQKLVCRRFGLERSRNLLDLYYENPEEAEQLCAKYEKATTLKIRRNRILTELYHTHKVKVFEGYLVCPETLPTPCITGKSEPCKTIPRHPYYTHRYHLFLVTYEGEIYKKNRSLTIRELEEEVWKVMTQGTTLAMWKKVGTENKDYDQYVTIVEYPRSCIRINETANDFKDRNTIAKIIGETEPALVLALLPM